jgi:hypothetical protein
VRSGTAAKRHSSEPGLPLMAFRRESRRRTVGATMRTVKELTVAVG